MTRAIASAQENILQPFSHEGDGQRIDLNCSIMTLTSTPERKAKEASLPIASSCDAAQPPARIHGLAADPGTH